jgi:hypothetical protein
MRPDGWTHALGLSGLLLIVGCAGVTPGLQFGRDGEPEVNATVSQVVRAASAVFRTENLPVDLADEFGGEVRSGSFDPWERWGLLAEERLSCGHDASGVPIASVTRSVRLELRVEARRVAGTLGVAPSAARTHVWVSGSGEATLDGESVRCGVAPDYLRTLTEAITLRAARTPARF